MLKVNVGRNCARSVVLASALALGALGISSCTNRNGITEKELDNVIETCSIKRRLLNHAPSILVMPNGRDARAELLDAQINAEQCKELLENGVDSTPYFGNYGKAKVAIDSLHDYHYCNEHGIIPKSKEDAEFLADSLKADKYGLEMYQRNADPEEKVIPKINIKSEEIQEKLGEIIHKTEEMSGLLEQKL